jgi:S1-C subfamily serine protease
MKKLVTTLAAIVAVLAATAAIAGDHAKAAKGDAEACLSAKAAKIAQHGWLGIETEKAPAGWRVTSVYEGSPAARAGFRAGDVLVALNGVRLAEDNMEAVKAAKSKLKVGSQVAYTVTRDSGERQLSATLGEVPQEVLAQWLGEDVLDHHLATQVADGH